MKIVITCIQLTQKKYSSVVSFQFANPNTFPKSYNWTASRRTPTEPSAAWDQNRGSLERRGWRRRQRGGGGDGATVVTTIPTTSSPWTPKVWCNFTRASLAAPAVGVFFSRLIPRTRIIVAAVMPYAEQEELVRSLEQKQAQQSRRWRVRFWLPIGSAWRLGGGRSCRGRRDVVFVPRFGDFVLTSPTVLRSASSRGSYWVTRPSWSTPASTMPGLPGSWLVAYSYLVITCFFSLCFVAILCPIVEIYLTCHQFGVITPQIRSIRDWDQNHLVLFCFVLLLLDRCNTDVYFNKFIGFW